MKKIIIIAILAVTSFLGSCSDAYDIEQPGFVTDETRVFSNPADVKRGVGALYAVIPAEDEVQFTSFYTDELGIGLNNLGQGINDGSYQFNLISSNEYATRIWSNYFNLINRANRIINRVEELIPTATASEENEYNASLAELYGLRAYAHYKLFAYFTPDYTDPNGLSVIKFNFLQTDNYSRFEKRSTVSEIVDFIQSDVDKAKELGGITNAVSSGYASNAMLESILIKMYSMVQTADGYEKLEQSFNRLVEDSGKGISDAGEYLSMYQEASGDGQESIFRYLRISTDGAGVQSGVASAWYPAAVDAQSQLYMEIGRSLYNELDKLDPSQTGKTLHEVIVVDGVEKDTTYFRSDVRYLSNVLTGSKVAPNYQSLSPDDYLNQDVLRIGKYTGISNRPLMNDIWLFRFTDMLLALAEKRAFENMTSGTVALGDFSNVESIIYNIRAYRNINGTNVPLSMPTDFSTPQAAYARILEERRLDFAFEGHRYLDMKRLGVKAGSPGFVRHEKDCLNVCSLEPTSYKLTMPIPRPEIVANPNMVQNPGY